MVAILNGQELKLYAGKYSDDFVAVAERLRAQGSVGMVYIAELATLLGVSTNTIWRWTLRHPDFRAVVDAANVNPVDLTEQSLFRRANGYEFEAERIDVLKFRDVERDPETGKVVAVSERAEVVRTPYIEHVPADVAAQKFILTNLRNERWRDRRAVEVTGKGGGPIEHQHSGAVDRLIGMLAERRKMIDVTP